jgi:lathosterol oxidase
MDLVINLLDDLFLDAIYASTTGWARDHIWRQVVTLFHVLSFGGAVVYFLFASLSYIFLFDKR